jgi:DNA-binding NtrC family response regulator
MAVKRAQGLKPNDRFPTDEHTHPSAKNAVEWGTHRFFPQPLKSGPDTKCFSSRSGRSHPLFLHGIEIAPVPPQLFSSFADKRLRTVHSRESGGWGMINQPMQPGREQGRWTPPRRPMSGPIPELVSRSLAMRRVCEQLQQVSPRVRLVLIEGEAGTGKHLLARHIQQRHASPGMLVVEEATGLFPAEGSSNSELRSEPLRAAVRRAAEGVLLIRNIDELSGESQAQLLRYIRTFETSVSAEKTGTLPFPAQLICTSRKPLRSQVLAGAFVPEIYYRLSAVSFTLPPLRDRKEDIPALVQMFIDTVSREQQKALQGLGPGSLPILLRHTWPGNVRELESVVRAACLSTEAQWLRPIDLVILPLETPGSKEGEPALPENFTLDGVIRRHILQVLKACDGNKARAASKLGISRSTLYRMLEADIATPMQPAEPKQPEPAPSIAHHD